MKDEKSNLEWMIHHHEWDLSVREIAFPIIMLFPCIGAYICFLVSQIWLGIGLVAFVIAMSFFTYFYFKGEKKYIAEMKKELEDLRKNKK